MRPEKISKLAMFTQTQEPLVYLFIINADFILDDECKILPPFGMAGVSVKNKRIKFYYKTRMLELSREELYFIVLHEAHHIFKRHLDRHLDLHKENPLILNCATDMVINEEIAAWPVSNSKTGIKPRVIEDCQRLDREYIDANRKLGKQAWTTRRIYNYLMNKEIKKENLLYPGAYVRIKGTDTYGQVEDKVEKPVNSYKVGTMSKSDFENEIMGGKKKPHQSGVFDIDELIPVVRGGPAYGRPKEVDFEVEHIDPVDTHLPQEELDDIEQEVLAKKIFEQAKDMADKSSKGAGNTAGHFLSSIEKLYIPKVNWKRELNKHLNLFYSNNCKTKSKRESFITYPWNPKSRYGILCKHTIEEVGNKQKYIIIAIDTSGSVFYDKKEMQTFFTEIEAMAKWFEFTKEGTILSIQWDSEIAEGLKAYQKGDWKKYELRGGGGTTPQVVFDYLTEIYEKKGNHYVVKQDKVKFSIDDPKKLPFVVVLTDGYFYSKLKKKNLGVYKDCVNNVLFFTKSEGSLSKSMKRIVYEG